MSQSEPPSDKRRSSVRELERHETSEEARYRRERTERQEPLQARTPAHETKEDDTDIDEIHDEEERLDRAMELMAETEPTKLDLEVGDLEKVSDDLIIERTEEGFATYLVLE